MIEPYHPLVVAKALGFVATGISAGGSADWRIVVANGAITLAATALAAWLRKKPSRRNARKPRRNSATGHPTKDQ